MVLRQIVVDVLKQVRLSHVAGGLAVMGVVQATTLWAMAQSYHWFFAEEEAKQRSFLERYGRPTQAQRMEAYTWMAPTYDSSVETLEKGIADHYRKHVFQDASGDILEVAVGTGRIFNFLRASEVRSFMGVDLNEAMLAEARKKLGDLPFEAKVILGDGHALPFPEKSFDTVIGSMCLCAMEDPGQALAEMLRVCRPHGKVLLVEPGVARFAPTRWAQRHLGLVPNPTHEWEYGYRDDNDVYALLESCQHLKVNRVQVRGMGNWYLVWAQRSE
ncbi:unnamed protein product [Durusdinium trenchii]|uniref:Methyltransferase type 11 domain-containing protein n=3 Tax=Durusdinium trenchii TaxID=1381693 RepID=A0ABP0JYC0_9DINO